MKNKTVFEFNVKEPGMLGKSKNDETVFSTFDYQEALDKLKKLNNKRTTGYAYIKFDGYPA